jgi:hypothetical protein
VTPHQTSISNKRQASFMSLTILAKWYQIIKVLAPYDTYTNAN